MTAALALPATDVVSDEEFGRRLGQCHAELLRHGRRLAGPDEAEDLVQDAMLLMWKRRASYHATSGNFNAWAYTCLRNTFLDGLRRPAAKNRLVLVDSYEQLPSQPTAAAGQDMAAEHVRHVMELHLAPHLSLALKLKMLGHTYQEIAQLLNINYSAARGRCDQARQALRQKLNLRTEAGQ